MKDMLLTYNEYNRDLGYVQGMSDLLAPIYAVEQDDAVAFWGFVGFMERMERNFLRDQSGMRLQLMTLDHLCQLLDPALYEHLQRLDSTNFFFFFRMLLVWFKREFDFSDILRLWEGLWTDFLSSNFHLFIAMAILEKHRNVIMEHLKGFDEVLKYVNELSGTIDLPSTLVRAEGLFRRFQRMVEAIDKKNNFPTAPTMRQRLPQPPSPSATRPGSDGRPRRTSASSPQELVRRTSADASRQSSEAQRRPSESSRRPSTHARTPSGSAGASTSGRDGTTGDYIAAGMSMERERVISPELRSLLSRKPPKLDKTEVRAHGGGVGS
jgi:TBC1 domain family member 15